MQPVKKRKRGYAAGVGGLFMLLALIGVVTIVVAGFRLTASLLDNQRQKTLFQDMIQPVVMFDPVPFSSPKDIEPKRLLLYSMWTTLSQESIADNEMSENQALLLVPASQLDVAAKQLFGDSVTLQHQTFSDNESTYFYDEKAKTYEVPTAGYLYVFRPEVTDIQRDGDQYKLTVKYIPPDNAWVGIYKGATPGLHQEKTMIYLMEKVEGGWHLLSVQDPPREEGQDDLASEFYESLDDQTPTYTEDDLISPEESGEEPVAEGAPLPTPPPEPEPEEDVVDTDPADADAEEAPADEADEDTEETPEEDEIVAGPAAS